MKAKEGDCSETEMTIEKNFALTIKHQGLKQMPSVVLSHLTGITRLDLSYNEIRSVAVDGNSKDTVT